MHILILLFSQLIFLSDGSVVVVGWLFMVAPSICGVSVFVHCFVVRYIRFFLGGGLVCGL